MRFYLNELSIESQFYDTAAVENAIQTIVDIIDIIKITIKVDHLLLKNAFICNRCFKNNQPFWQSINRINRNLRQRFLLVINRHASTWNEAPIHNENDSFIVTNINNQEVRGSSIAEAAERTIQNTSRLNFIINFINSTYSPYRHIVVTKNQSDYNISINAFDNNAQIITAFPITFDYYLQNNISEFTDTGRFCRMCNSRVYLDGKGRYWVFDRHHNSHYEIYNHSKEHIGIADLDGRVDKIRRVPGRFLILN